MPEDIAANGGAVAIEGCDGIRNHQVSSAAGGALSPKEIFDRRLRSQGVNEASDLWAFLPIHMG